MRPTSRVVPDGPIEDAGVYDCAESMDENGNIILKNTTNKDRKNCVDATFDKNGIQIGGKHLTHQDHVGSGHIKFSFSIGVGKQDDGFRGLGRSSRCIESPRVDSLYRQRRLIEMRRLGLHIFV